MRPCVERRKAGCVPASLCVLSWGWGGAGQRGPVVVREGGRGGSVGQLPFPRDLDGAPRRRARQRPFCVFVARRARQRGGLQCTASPRNDGTACGEARPRTPPLPRRRGKATRERRQSSLRGPASNRRMTRAQVPAFRCPARACILSRRRGRRRVRGGAPRGAPHCLSLSV